MKLQSIKGKSKKYLFILPVFMLAILSTFILANSFISTASTSNPEGSIKYGSKVCVSVINENGRIDYPCKHNLVVNAGLNAIRDTLRGSASFTNFTFLALGNSSNVTSGADPLATDTFLSAEYSGPNGLNRTAGSQAILGTGNWTVWASYTSAGIALNTNKTCIFNQSTGGTMLACVNFPETQLQGASSDVLLVNWTIFTTSG